MVTNVYVDGPNLYYGALKNSAARWLDLRTWLEKLLPGQEVKRIRYVTAWANPSPNGSQASRQKVYLRALATVPGLSIHLGRCLTETSILVDATDIRISHHVVKVRQQGVDVALVTLLLKDAATKDCDTAVVVSSDSDLRLPVTVARETFGTHVGVVNPRRGRVGLAMREVADFHLRPPKESYEAAQFPKELSDAKGTFHVPKSWLTAQPRR